MPLNINMHLILTKILETRVVTVGVSNTITFYDQGTKTAHGLGETIHPMTI